MMFLTGSQLVFHMQLARKRDAAPIVRDYITDLQRTYPTFPCVYRKPKS
jgi:cyclopropane-fatty-acyl-phospholipid synthase